MAARPDRSEVEKLNELMALRAFVDEQLELGLLEHRPLNAVMKQILNAMNSRLGLSYSFVKSFGEDLKMQIFASPSGKDVPRAEEVFDRTSELKRERLVLDLGGETLIAQPLDVVGEWFGCAGCVVPRPLAEVDTAHAATMLNLLCEVIDNYLFTIKAAREKHRVMMALGSALRHRVLSEGLKQAAKILVDATPVQKLLLVFMAEEHASSNLHVQLYENGFLTVDTLAGGAANRDLIADGREYLAGRTSKLLQRFDLLHAQEEVLINGVTKSVIVGKVVASSKRGEFNTYSRELLSGFAGFIRQRVVDFNKEWRRLSASFSADEIAKLLQSDDYEERYLSPREASVAILYADISGFTRLSEQVLKSPSAVAAFVEAWSRDAVDLLFKYGGVFDKMVGDCIIGLFGPPFYEGTPAEALARAIKCAKDIRAMTRELSQRDGLKQLQGEAIGVATGIHLAPLFVGTFGPNGNFTGFSSGMNNTARLQGCAKRDQILVMSEAVAVLPKGEFQFGPEGSAAVKNVAEPLKFYPLNED